MCSRRWLVIFICAILLIRQLMMLLLTMSELLTNVGILRDGEQEEAEEEDVSTVSRSVVMPFAETHDSAAREHLAPTQRN